MKVGYVSIVGKPNVGKSTLVNAIFNKKISIVTDKSQTTRNSIDAVYEDENSQIIFVDTPGIHKPEQVLGTAMNKESYNSLRGSDVCLFILDAGHRFNESDRYLFEHLQFDCPLIIVFNKIDTTNILLIEENKKFIKEKYKDACIFEISAKDKFNIKELVELIKTYLPEGSKVEFNRDELDYSFTISEVIRERALNVLDKEVPHSLFVRVDNVEKKGKMIDAIASIFVEKESQKSIVIGKSGSMIKRIGSSARVELEHILHTHVNLNLTVKVSENWRNNSKTLGKIGYRM